VKKIAILGAGETRRRGTLSRIGRFALHAKHGIRRGWWEEPIVMALDRNRT